MTSAANAIVELGKSVSTREDFVVFLAAFAADYKQTGEVWENSTLSGFLEAMSAWSHDCPGYYRNAGPQVDLDKPSWRVFADILLAARVYE